MEKLKVLFFAEGATLAHVVRPLMLARGLDPTCFLALIPGTTVYISVTAGMLNIGSNIPLFASSPLKVTVPVNAMLF